MNPITVQSTGFIPCTDVDAQIDIPANVAQIVYHNEGANYAYVNLGAAAVAGANLPIAPGAYFTVSIPANLASRTVHAICDATLTTTLACIFGWGE